MRIYIIGNDGITRCGETTPQLNAGEIAIGSSEDLRAAPLSGKRLLALWNALPGVEKRKKVGDRDALIDQLWSAIEMLPEPEPPSEESGRRSRARSLRCCVDPRVQRSMRWRARPAGSVTRFAVSSREP